MTWAAARSTLFFLFLDIAAIGWIGDAAATHFGFNSNILTIGTALICVAAGYVATLRGAWGATAGSAITSIEAVAWIVTGHLTPDIAPSRLKVPVAVSLVLFGAVGGAVCGAAGGWLAHRRHPTIAAANQRY